MLRLINPSFRGYLTLDSNNYIGNESAGVITFVVNRVAGNYTSLGVQYTTTNGTAVSGTNYYGATNTLSWISGDASSRTVSITLTNDGRISASKQFGVRLFNPTQNNTNQPALFFVGSPGSITNATLTINNDNSYGTVQFSASSYIVNENGGHATITVLRTGGIAGPCSINFPTSPGANTTPGVNGNYDTTNGTLIFAANQTAASFDVNIHNDGMQDPPYPGFYFNVTLSNPTNTVLGSPAKAKVNILDATATWLPARARRTASSSGHERQRPGARLADQRADSRGRQFLVRQRHSRKWHRPAERRWLAGHRRFPTTALFRRQWSRAGRGLPDGWPRGHRRRVHNADGIYHAITSPA